MSLNLRKYEEPFKLVPIGIRYKCEACNEGEMIYDYDPTRVVYATNPPLIPHICTKCGMKLDLPKTYPYIEWIPEDEINDGGGIDEYIKSAKVSLGDKES
jgi:hypothetical protein